MLLLTTVAGNTGWHHMIFRHARYAPSLSNYAGAAGGRTFPSAAGFHTCEIFFTNDDGIFFLPTRDCPAVLEHPSAEEGDLETLLQAHRARVRKLSDQRLFIPPSDPWMEGHNTWVANRPGTLFIIPVVDLAQHMIACLCYLVQNGYGLVDDLSGAPIAGLERFSRLLDQGDPMPLSRLEQDVLAECSVEIATACYAGVLMLQAMGLGGWMFDGIDRYTVLGASGDPSIPGLGFRSDTDERWPFPNPTGLPGVFEAFCPPHYPDMRAAVEAFAQRKFGPGGPFHPDTPGPWKDSRRMRSSAQVHSEEFKECVALMAQHIYDRFGRFPATLPSVYALMYLQAHHLDLSFYDRFYKPGAYLETHARHMERWHGGNAF